MNKYHVTILVLLIIVVISFKCCKSKNETPNKEVDSLKIEIEQLHDTIIIIDTKIDTITKEYEKISNIILTQPADSDCRYFLEYLSKDSVRFSNYNN